MKILDILVKENFDFDDSGRMSDGDGTGFLGQKASISDLSSLDLRTLNRLKDGIITIDDASDSELERIMDLQAQGFISIDDDGNVTFSDDDVTDPADLSSEYRTRDTSGMDDVELGDDDIDLDMDDNSDFNREVRPDDDEIHFDM